MDAVETMAYAGEVPWHSKGKNVRNDMSTDEMLVESGCDWEVEKEPLYFRVPSADGKIKMRIVPGEYGLIRSTDQAYLDTVGENWKPIQNREVFDFFKRFVVAGDMSLETAGSLKGGKFIWALARINESFNLGKGDVTNGYMLLSQPHQFGFSMTAALTPVRVVCWNTLNMALGSKLDGSQAPASYRLVHSRAFDDTVKAEAERALGLAHDSMKAFSHTAQLLSGVAAKDDAVTDYFHNVLRLEREEAVEGEDPEENENRTVRKFREALTHAPGQDLFKGTWWNSFNAVTYTVDHQLGRTDDTRLYSAWYGTGANTKRRALELAVDYAKAT